MSTNLNGVKTREKFPPIKDFLSQPTKRKKLFDSNNQMFQSTSIGNSHGSSSSRYSSTSASIPSSYRAASDRAPSEMVVPRFDPLSEWKEKVNGYDADEIQKLLYQGNETEMANYKNWLGSQKHALRERFEVFQNYEYGEIPLYTTKEIFDYLVKLLGAKRVAKFLEDSGM